MDVDSDSNESDELCEGEILPLPEIMWTVALTSCSVSYLLSWYDCTRNSMDSAVNQATVHNFKIYWEMKINRLCSLYNISFHFCLMSSFDFVWYFSPWPLSTGSVTYDKAGKWCVTNATLPVIFLLHVWFLANKNRDISVCCNLLRCYRDCLEVLSSKSG